MEPPATTTMTAGSRDSHSVEETRAFGRALGAAAEAGTVLALRGPLGAGKTQLAKGVAVGLGIENVVNSPTFVLMNEHPGRLRLFHIDAYRLADPDGAAAAGLLDDRMAEGMAVIEWADRLDGWLPNERLEVSLQPHPTQPDRRFLAWRAHGPAHQALVRRAGLAVG